MIGLFLGLFDTFEHASGDDTMHTDDDDEEEEEEEEEEEDLWQAVHALLEFRPLTSLESTDKMAASEKWYTSSRSLLLPNRSLLSLESTDKMAASEKWYCIKNIIILIL